MSRTTLRRTMRSRFRVFSPMDIPDLGLDLDASYGVLNSIGPDVPATNGQAVRRWLDKSGNGCDFDQSTATNQPSFSAGGFDGLAAVYFDGVNDWLSQIAGLDLLSGVPGGTLLLVSKIVSMSSNRSFFRATQSAGTGSRLGFQQSSGVNRASLRRLDSDSPVLVTAGANVASNRIYSVVADYQGAAAEVYVDALLSDSSSPVGWNGPSDAAPSAEISLGGFSVGENAEVYIARVLVWPRALTASELAQVHTYLSQTYGIPLA